MARARGGGEDKGRWFALSVSSVIAEPGDQGAGRYRREGHGVTDDSALKKQIRARMAETGEKYTVARRMVVAGRAAGQPPVVLRVYLNPNVDVALTAEAGRAYAAADEQGRREIVGRLLAEQIEVAGADAGLAAGSKVVTDLELRAEAEAAQDAAVRGVVQRGVERAVGLSAVEVSRAADRLRVDIRAARPILLAGPRGAEADRLRGELEELTGRRVRLDIREVPDPQEESRSAGSERAG
ncbi:MAG TPA: KH domain-containing protein [Actinophytocola sp.]|uniref:KH domain-containing protein n=1 Tax=Actinophytocola sp. TaxID=1872138 RepID=UPI002DBA7E86|nr:KH domain-containing protein [Actinophytocola sp.]HEU5470272.1 KH domain-containing protein [Actinophytocola sp.]